MTEFILNNTKISTETHPGTTMLDFVRYEKHLKGTKIGCREGDCGACTVLVGELVNQQLKYNSVTSCLMPIGNAHGKHIVTIEGINLKELNNVQQAIVEEGGTQCGFCTVGFVMSLVGFSINHTKADYENGIAAIDGNICRCTGYKSLERAVKKITQELNQKSDLKRLDWLIAEKYIPEYFREIAEKLSNIEPIKKTGNLNIGVGGGTDLYVQKHDSMHLQNLEFLFNDPLLKNIIQEKNKIIIGASVTVEEMSSSALMQSLFPNLKAHLKLVSSTPIRNMATIAGNFTNASPIGDMTIFFLALNASIDLMENSKIRTILLKDFYKGYKILNKNKEEKIVRIHFETPKGKRYFNFEKVCKRTHLDIASVNHAIQLTIHDDHIAEANVAIGGVFAYPLYLNQTSTFLRDKKISAENILAAEKIMQSEITPISDARGKAEYKRLLARQLFFAHFIVLLPSFISPDDLIPIKSII